MTVQMIIRTAKVRKGDVIVQQVPDEEHPYREVRLTECPVSGELIYEGTPHYVRYLTGYDDRANRVVMLTGTEFQMWQVLRGA